MSQDFLNTTTHNIAWIHKRYIADELQLKAPFQRNPVWTAKQKSYLIDTILRGFPIPELYMQEFTDANGNDVYVVVDGQQRIRACEGFIAGEFAINGEDSPEWADMTFNDLSETDKRQIYNYKFVVRVLPDMADKELRSMFQRLNRNVVALNRQELRHATYWGEFITCMESLSNDERWAGMSLFTPNDIRRMLDTEFISELVVAHLHGLQNKKESLDKWYKTYEETFEDRSSVEATCNAVLGEIKALLPDIANTRWRKKSDFYSLFLVLAEQKQRLPWSSDVRAEVSIKLTEFGQAVDRLISDPSQEDTAGEVVKAYVFAVQKAASDLGNRRSRRTALLLALAPHAIPSANASMQQTLKLDENDDVSDSAEADGESESSDE
jgi:hypothetical protein